MCRQCMVKLKQLRAHETLDVHKHPVGSSCLGTRLHSLDVAHTHRLRRDDYLSRLRSARKSEKCPRTRVDAMLIHHGLKPL